jgi:hypothetical protein
MQAATSGAAATALASTPLKPYAHQQNAVYGAMLPQPRLRFLLADEPGTGKTIMAGLYLREMQRLGLVRRGLVVAPANLVTKWQADFERFLGGGLRRITAATIREDASRWRTICGWSRWSLLRSTHRSRTQSARTAPAGMWWSSTRPTG